MSSHLILTVSLGDKDFPISQMGKLRYKTQGLLTKVTHLVNGFELRSTWLYNSGLALINHAALQSLVSETQKSSEHPYTSCLQP